MPERRILVIDDEPAVAEGCRLVLSEAGYQAEVRRDGRSGLDALRSGRYDLALLDMKLPDLGGLEVLEASRHEAPGVYIIVITGHSTVQNAVQAMKLGAFDYLAKPFSDDELLLAVARTLEKKDLVEENAALKKQLLEQYGFDNIVGESPALRAIFQRIRKVAPTETTVLLVGESGTGKELFARALHAHSPRAARPFVAVDCGAFAPGLLESELFGHVKGAFTGAVQDKAGIFEAASTGTLFLDEASNLAPETQAHLLRVLETGEFKPVGGTRIKKTEARVIAATNRDLAALVEEGRFREDLYFRLNVFPIHVPPLRERRDDIPRLAYHFLRQFCRQTRKRITGFSDDALAALLEYHWPGNVRQLRNVVERLVILSEGGTMDALALLENLPAQRFQTETPIPDTVEELNALKKRLLEDGFGRLQKAFLIKALRACGGNVTRAAERVGMKRPNFSALLKKYGLSPESRQERSNS
ncbi:MAG: sigma-54 dependent transcriptional regulator [Thermodesulfobacteriota bacterium]